MTDSHIKLLTAAEVKATLLCEICKAEIPAKPWPAGWTRTGRSRLRAAIDRRDPTVNANFCPAHQASLRAWINPTSAEIRGRIAALESAKVAK